VLLRQLDNERPRQTSLGCAGQARDQSASARTLLCQSHTASPTGAAQSVGAPGGMPSGGRIGGGGSAPCGAPGRGGGGGRPPGAAPMGAGGSVDLSGALRLRSAARCSAIARICASPCTAAQRCLAPALTRLRLRPSAAPGPCRPGAWGVLSDRVHAGYAYSYLPSLMQGRSEHERPRGCYRARLRQRAAPCWGLPKKLSQLLERCTGAPARERRGRQPRSAAPARRGAAAGGARAWCARSEPALVAPSQAMGRSPPLTLASLIDASTRCDSSSCVDPAAHPKPAPLNLYLTWRP